MKYTESELNALAEARANEKHKKARIISTLLIYVVGLLAIVGTFCWAYIIDGKSGPSNPLDFSNIDNRVLIAAVFTGLMIGLKVGQNYIWISEEKDKIIEENK